MKVIEHGDTIKEHSCENCGCVFQYSKKDIQIERVIAFPFSDYPFDFDIVESIRCPECNYRYIISSEQEEYLQLSIKEKALEKSQNNIKTEKKGILRKIKSLMKGGL